MSKKVKEEVRPHLAILCPKTLWIFEDYARFCQYQLQHPTNRIINKLVQHTKKNDKQPWKARWVESQSGCSSVAMSASLSGLLMCPFRFQDPKYITYCIWILTASDVSELSRQQFKNRLMILTHRYKSVS